MIGLTQQEQVEFERIKDEMWNQRVKQQIIVTMYMQSAAEWLLLTQPLSAKT